MKMRLFDSHAHLDDEKFSQDREELINTIKESDTTNFISAGYSIEGSIKALELARKYSFIYATVGISPNDIPQSEERILEDIQKIENLIQEELKIENIEKLENATSIDKAEQIKKFEQNENKTDAEELKKNSINGNVINKNIEAGINKRKKLVAIGEIGLDYYWEKDEKMKELQRVAFIKQIELANKYDFPIVIHTRDAVMDTLDILKNNEVKKKGVFHCCPQNRELIKEALKLGFYISFAGPITFKNSKNADEVINLVPNDRLLIETDSPYLAPEPVRGTRNDPRNVKYVAEKIANVKNISLEDVANFTFSNVKKIFGI